MKRRRGDIKHRKLKEEKDEYRLWRSICDISENVEDMARIKRSDFRKDIMLEDKLENSNIFSYIKKY